MEAEKFRFQVLKTVKNINKKRYLLDAKKVIEI